MVAGNPLYVAYHDEEWGVPSHDDRYLFEMLTLEGAQAGLSWSTILKKRDGYRRAFAGFDTSKVARFDGRKVERLLQDPGQQEPEQQVEPDTLREPPGREQTANGQRGIPDEGDEQRDEQEPRQDPGADVHATCHFRAVDRGARYSKSPPDADSACWRAASMSP